MSEDRRTSTDADPDLPIAAAEDWFRQNGLPWFVDSVDERVRELLGRRRLWVLLVGVTAVAVFAGWLARRASGSLSTSIMVAVTVALVLVLGYAGGPLKVAVMARWAARRVLSELDLLVPLVTRALPLLLLFMTFFFINTEVWQVTAAMDRSSLYAVVLLFAAIGTAFLLTRLPDEVRRVQRSAQGEGIVRACQGTPLESQARRFAEGGAAEADAGMATTLTRPQRANLVLALLVTQAIQVTLLTIAVFAFFVGFGLLAIPSTVVESWLGARPTPITVDLWLIDVQLPVTTELYQVSVFLAAFAGLYFTVAAVSDADYREQFFAGLSEGLEQAVGVRAVYRWLVVKAAAAAPSPSSGTGAPGSPEPLGPQPAPPPETG